MTRRAAQEALSPHLRAVIEGPTTIRFSVSGVERPAERTAYRLTDGQGWPLPIAEIRPDTAAGALFVPAVTLDAMRVNHSAPGRREAHGPRAGARFPDLGGGAVTGRPVFLAM